MRTTIRALLGVALLAAVAPAQAGESVDAAAVYADHCAKCHGETGRAESWRGRLFFAQDFSKDSFQSARSDEEILEKINRGPRIMPAYRDTLSLEQRKALVQLIRSFAKP